MADSFKVLGQADIGTTAWSGTAADITTVYTAPGTPHSEFAPRQIMQSIVSVIIVANRSTSHTYHIRVIPKGETGADKHIIISGRTLGNNATDILSLGIGLSSGDKIQAYAGAATFSMSVFGLETL
jgi:hypothetical protein